MRFTNAQIKNPDLLISKVRAALGIREIKKPEIVALVSDASDLKKMIDKKNKDNNFLLIAKKAAKTAIRQERIENRKAERNGLKAENAKLRKELKELKASLKE